MSREPGMEASASDPIFEPLRFRKLVVENRVFRSSIAGRFDGWDGSGQQARINWRVRFARAGVGAIVSAWCGVDRRGLIVPGYASIERDDRVPFWREVGERVHEHGSRFILQLAHADGSGTSPESSSARAQLHR